MVHARVVTLATMVERRCSPSVSRTLADAGSPNGPTGRQAPVFAVPCGGANHTQSAFAAMAPSSAASRTTQILAHPPRPCRRLMAGPAASARTGSKMVTSGFHLPALFVVAHVADFGPG